MTYMMMMMMMKMMMIHNKGLRTALLQILLGHYDVSLAVLHSAPYSTHRVAAGLRRIPAS